MESFCKHRLGKQKNLRSTSWDYLCMHERKKGKKNLLTKTDQSAAVPVMVTQKWHFSLHSLLRVEVLLPAISPHQVQSTEHTGMWCLFGFSQNEFGFPKWPCVSLYLLTFPLFCVLYKKTSKNKQGRFPTKSACYGWAPSTEKVKWSKVSFTGEANSLFHSTQVFFRLGSKTTL